MTFVLYVDRDPFIRSAVYQFLLSNEFKVQIATSGKEALEMLQSGDYDLILSEFDLSDITGIELLRKTRSLYGDIPFILFTGRGREEVLIDAINSGVDFYQQKGGEHSSLFAELLQKIRAATSKRIADVRLKTLNQLYSVLLEFGNAFGNLQEKKELFEEICKILVITGGFRMVWIGHVDLEQKSIIPVASYGYIAGYLDSIAISTEDVPRGQGPIGTAFREKRNFYSNNVITDPRMMPWRDECQKRGYRAIAAFPFSLDTLDSGVMAVYAPHFDFFTPEITRLLEEVTILIARALKAIDDGESRKILEGTLQGSEEKYQLVVENISDILAVSQGGYLKYVNQKAIDVMGHSADELFSQPMFEFIHPDDLDLVTSTYQKRMRGEPVPKQYPYRFIRKDGEVRWLEIRALSITWNEKPAILYFGTDITEHLKLKEREALSLRRIDENIHQMALLNDKIRNPLNIIGAICDFDNSPHASEIHEQIQMIQSMIEEVDRGWVESLKIREFLKRYHDIRYEENTPQ